MIPALQCLRQAEAIDRMDRLAYWGYALGRRIGELEAALRIPKEEEGFWAAQEDRKAKDSLQRSYGNQALILQAWGRLEEAMALHKKEEALCLELGNKSSLGYCYWQWSHLARAQGQRDVAREKLRAALAIFTELGMPRERDAVQSELDKLK